MSPKTKKPPRDFQVGDLFVAKKLNCCMMITRKNSGIYTMNHHGSTFAKLTADQLEGFIEGGWEYYPVRVYTKK